MVERVPLGEEPRGELRPKAVPHESATDGAPITGNDVRQKDSRVRVAVSIRRGLLKFVSVRKDL